MNQIELLMRFPTEQSARLFLPFIGAGFAVYSSPPFWVLRQEPVNAEQMLPRLQKHFPQYQFVIVRAAEELGEQS